MWSPIRGVCGIGFNEFLGKDLRSLGIVRVECLSILTIYVEQRNRANIAGGVDVSLPKARAPIAGECAMQIKRACAAVALCDIRQRSTTARGTSFARKRLWDSHDHQTPVALGENQSALEEGGLASRFSSPIHAIERRVTNTNQRTRIKSSAGRGLAPPMIELKKKKSQLARLSRDRVALLVCSLDVALAVVCLSRSVVWIVFFTAVCQDIDHLVDGQLLASII